MTLDRCKHDKAIAEHGSQKLCVARCPDCGKRWKGDPSKPNAPRWVKESNARYLDALAAKGRTQ